uniref:Uncharacterized protein n=1 Tax=Cacopsylla melanoneura TaxID=428564 RepID=A0A8D8TB10_9HEMI
MSFVFTFLIIDFIEEFLLPSEDILLMELKVSIFDSYVHVKRRDKSVIGKRVHRMVVRGRKGRGRLGPPTHMAEFFHTYQQHGKKIMRDSVRTTATGLKPQLGI